MFKNSIHPEMLYQNIEQRNGDGRIENRKNIKQTAKTPVGRRDHVKPINHASAEASDAGASLIELVISTAIAGILLISVAGLIGMAIRTFGTQDDNTSNPHRITQHALARTAERMMIIEECANPTTATDHEKCLERAEISFPKPVPRGDWPNKYDPLYTDHHNVLCWMVDSRDTDDNQRRPAVFTNGTNEDFRDLECWDHDPPDKNDPDKDAPEKGTITIHTHHPSETATDTSTEYSPEWNDGSYRSSYITNRIERLGYCTRNSNHSVTGIKEKDDCNRIAGHTWHNPWGCVEGTDTDRRSALDAGPAAISDVIEKTCDQTFTNGVAVLILRVCVSMTPAELERRSSDDNEWAEHPLTCNGKNIVVTPGRK